MIAKCFEVRDSMTFIPVLAVNTAPSCEGQRYLLRRSGYSPDASTVILVNLNDAKARNDPYEWGNSRTMSAAHIYIEERFAELNDGDVIDVEFILGETTAPKESEARS
jgi:hypothetical protein